MNRRSFFSQTLKLAIGAPAALRATPVVQTKFAIDKFSVERTIENFNPSRPLIPWRKNSDRVLYGGLHIWWNPWEEKFGLWAEDTRQLFVIKESR